MQRLEEAYLGGHFRKLLNGTSLRNEKESEECEDICELQRLRKSRNWTAAAGWEAVVCVVGEERSDAKRREGVCEAALRMGANLFIFWPWLSGFDFLGGILAGVCELAVAGSSTARRALPASRVL